MSNPETATATQPAEVKPPKNLNSDLLVGFGSLVLTGVAYLVTRDLSYLGGVFVNYVLVVLGFLSVVEIFKGFTKPEMVRFFESRSERANVLAGITILVVYLILLPFAGFSISSFLFYGSFNLYLADDRSTKSIVQSVILSAVVVALFYLIFHNFLEVPLPKGSWWAE